MLSHVDEELDKSTGSFIYDVTKPVAIEFERKEKEIQSVKDKLDIENLTGDELERFVYQKTGITKKVATKATTTVIISGSTGALIKKGDLVGTDTIHFVSLEEKSIDESGLMYVLVECEQFGAIGNVPANSINKFPVTIQGLVNVYNPEKVTNGYDAESDTDLRNRYYDKLQKPAKAGNKYHYEQWAKSVTGVGNARVFPRWNGLLTVKVVIIDSNKQPASLELISDVNQFIENEAPFGADVTVTSATPISININVNLTIAEGYTETQAIESIEDNITNYLQEIAFVETYVSYARLGSIIIESEGVLDYQNLQVNGGTANIPIQEEEVAIIGGVNE